MPAKRAIDAIHDVDIETILRRAVGELLAAEAETKYREEKLTGSWHGWQVDRYYRMTTNARERLIELRLSLERHLL